MRNVFFKKEILLENDLYFICSMIGLIARNIKQLNKHIVNRMGYQTLAEKRSLANALHLENPLAVVYNRTDTYIDNYNISTHYEPSLFIAHSYFTESLN